MERDEENRIAIINSSGGDYEIHVNEANGTYSVFSVPGHGSVTEILSGATFRAAMAFVTEKTLADIRFNFPNSEE